ncbi:MAG: LamG domain-containing protein, partial [Verrucomicrobiales bacterium]
AQHQFDLSKANWAGKAHTGSSAILAKPPSFDAGGALVLQGDNFIDVPGTRVADLPSEAFTIEAEVAIERGTKWGNIVGYMQDNGAYERGFSLGYNESSFTVWISTGGRAIFAIADTPYVPGQWYEVAASYDGRRLVLTIDGEVAASTDASGAIAYPDVAQLTIGAYRDQDEFYPMQGKLRTVRIRDKAMAIIPGASGLTVRPSVQFLTPGSAKIAWGAEPPGATLAIGTSKPPGDTINVTENEFTVEGLAPRTIYYYKINGGKTHSFNTALNFTPPPIPQSAPSGVLEMTDLRKGYCVIFGADAPLAEEIASNSDFTVIGIDTNQAAVAAARRSLYEKSIYGTRISMMHIESFDRLPFTDGIANLVVADRANPEIERISASGRSTVIIGGEARDSSRPAASKDWSHQYGEPGNSANGGDSLGGVRNTSELGVRWFGRPGADFGLDRQSRMPAPLSVAGRLFHQGMDRLAALDANNGSVLWGLEVPDMRRLNMPRDASNWCADQDHLYLAVKERAWIIDAERGT